MLNSYGVVPGAWGRGFGQSADQERSSSIVGHGFQLAPEFDGHIWGLQTGFDLLGRENGDGSQERLGLFYTHMEARGDITGNILAGNHLNAGDLKLDGDGIGAYWTHVGSTGWYIDTVGMLNWFDGEADSSYGAGADISGNSVLLSLETGYPFALSGSWTLEPQAQLVWQRVDLDDTHDRFASIAYGAADTWMGRLGLRLESDTTMNEVPVQPFVDINLWHNFSSSYTSKFNDGSLETQMESTSLEVGAGVSTRLSANVSAYAALHYATSVDGDDNRSLGGNIGLLIKW